MHHQEFEPPEELRDAIKCFWYNVRDFGDRLSGFEVVPDGYAEIIFYFGELSSVSPDGVLRPLLSPFMTGLLNHTAVFETKGRLEIIGIRCYPWTVFDLLALPSGKAGAHVAGHAIARLQPVLEELIRTGEVDKALTEITRCFLNARLEVAMDSMLYKAGVAMRAANGTIAVSRIAEAAHATVRTLERKFKRSSGYSVKDVSGLMRFEQVRNRLWHQPDCNLAGLAHEFGYADQSHLNKEFKRYTGTTPAAFARKAVKGKQMVSDDFVAFLQA